MPTLEAIDATGSGKQSILKILGKTTDAFSTISLDDNPKNAFNLRRDIDTSGVYQVTSYIKHTNYRVVITEGIGEGVFEVSQAQVEVIAIALNNGCTLDEIIRPLISLDGTRLITVSSWETIKGRKEDAKREKLKKEIEERISLFSSQSLEFILDYINR